MRKVALPFLIDSVPRQQNDRLTLDGENFSPLEMVDLGFDVNLTGSEIRDSKGKKLGKVLTS